MTAVKRFVYEIAADHELFQIYVTYVYANIYKCTTLKPLIRRFSWQLHLPTNCLNHHTVYVIQFLYVCVCVCIYIRIYSYMYIHIYVYLYTCIYTYIYICMYIYICIHVHVYI